jgi:hypothetical protein
MLLLSTLLALNATKSVTSFLSPKAFIPEHFARAAFVVTQISVCFSTESCQPFVPRRAPLVTIQEAPAGQMMNELLEDAATTMG